MSMKPQSIPPVPSDTATVARAAFPKGNIYLQIRDTLGSVYIDEDFTSLFSERGQPAQSPWRLAKRVCDAVHGEPVRPSTHRFNSYSGSDSSSQSTRNSGGDISGSLE